MDAPSLADDCWAATTTDVIFVGSDFIVGHRHSRPSTQCTGNSPPRDVPAKFKRIRLILIVNY